MELTGYRENIARYGKKYLAIYHSLRASILSGRLRLGQRLPASRDLATEYGVSRGTVNIAYEMLLAEGYVSARPGSGTFVSFPGRPRQADASKSGPGKTSITPAFSRWSSRLPRSMRIPGRERTPTRLNFVVGQPDANEFPALAWKQTMHRALQEVNYLSSGADENDIFGYRPLREAVAAHLNRRRGLLLSADEICIVNGSIQAIALLTQLLVDPGTRVIMENPGYSGTREAVTAAGGKLILKGLDEDGIRLGNTRARLIFVTPSNQFPTGRVLSLQRRLELLEWARTNNAIVVEDDYDSEFHRKDRPIEPLKALDEEQSRVVFLGSFSKTLGPALRLGYAVLPRDLIRPFALARQVYETVPGGLIEQAAVANFMKSGRYEKHLRKMSRHYADKRELLIWLFDKHIPGAFDWNESAAGLHLFGRWRGTQKKFQRFTDNCQRRGLLWTDPRRFYAEDYQPSIALGFSHLSEKEMKAGVRIMTEEFRNL